MFQKTFFFFKTKHLSDYYSILFPLWVEQLYSNSRSGDKSSPSTPPITILLLSLLPPPYQTTSFPDLQVEDMVMCRWKFQNAPKNISLAYPRPYRNQWEHIGSYLVSFESSQVVYSHNIIKKLSIRSKVAQKKNIFYFVASSSTMMRPGVNIH